MENSKYEDEEITFQVNNNYVVLECRYCHKILSSKQNLKEHLYIHTGNRPYICTYPDCNKRFRQGSLLSIHKRIHIEVEKNLKREAAFKSTRYLFPKLTQLLSNCQTEITLDPANRDLIRNQIGEKLFKFVREFISEIN